MNKQTRIITAALPFVNNVPHLGNLAGSHLPADVFAHHCHCRRLGHTTYFIGGSDEQGTATELAAHKRGTTPQKLCDEYHEIHRLIYEWFWISYDRYSRTLSAHHKAAAQEFFVRLHERGLTKPNSVRVAYCRSCWRDLADRLIRGQSLIPVRKRRRFQ